MPQTEVVLYSEDDESVPLLEWLDRQPAKVQAKSLVSLERLRELGHELRPHRKPIFCEMASMNYVSGFRQSNTAYSISFLREGRSRHTA